MVNLATLLPASISQRCGRNEKKKKRSEAKNTAAKNESAAMARTTKPRCQTDKA